MSAGEKGPRAAAVFANVRGRGTERTANVPEPGGGRGRGVLTRVDSTAGECDLRIPPPWFEATSELPRVCATVLHAKRTLSHLTRRERGELGKGEEVAEAGSRKPWKLWEAACCTFTHTHTHQAPRLARLARLAPARLLKTILSGPQGSLLQKELFPRAHPPNDAGDGHAGQ